jgi:hypothetical protein
MTTIQEQWAHGSPEAAVADAFAAFRHRDVAGLIARATSASIRAVAFRVRPELDRTDSSTPAGGPDELSDGQAVSILGRLVARLPERFTDSVRCLIVGHVLESRHDATSPDGRGLIRLDCRVTGSDDAWLPVYADPKTQREIVTRAADVAHVVFRVAHEFPGAGTLPFPPEMQIATTQLASGEWKLVLDEWSDVGLPGFRGVGSWIDEGWATQAATDD